jgi:hypothetical protein
MESTCAATPLAMVVAASHQTPDKEEELEPYSLHRNQYTSPPLQTYDCGHHEFLNLSQFHGNLYLDIYHGIDKKVMLHATPS